MKNASPHCVLVTGGAGYIGSHAALELLRSGHRVIIVDTMENGSRDVIQKLEGLGPLSFVEADCGDQDRMKAILPEVDCIMHFAAYANVLESIEAPDRYQRNNVDATRSLLDAAVQVGVDKFIMSSTCAIYGNPSIELMPVNEDCPLDPLSPYGETKLQAENLVSEAATHAGLSAGVLRFFNVIGADASGLLPDRIKEGRLISACMLAARGELNAFTIHGTDYETSDGTAVRDFIHVTDIVLAHLSLMNHLTPGTMQIYNVGGGHGISVLQLLQAVEKISGTEIPVIKGDRRTGDIPAIWADNTRIRESLEWMPRYEDIESMVKTSWLAG